MSVRISRQHWQALLDELDDARRQRHLLTYRALVESAAADSGDADADGRSGTPGRA